MAELETSKVFLDRRRAEAEAEAEKVQQAAVRQQAATARQKQLLLDRLAAQLTAAVSDGGVVVETVVSQLQAELEAERTARQCCICLDGKADTVLMPCRHSGVCFDCAQKVRKCPLCRVPIDERLRVFG